MYSSLTSKGTLFYNATLIARIDGSIGYTKWAKVVNLTLLSTTPHRIISIRWDIEDNIWSILFYELTNKYYSALLKYDGDGNILNFFVFGKPEANGDYYLYLLEVNDMICIDNQNIIIQGKWFLLVLILAQSRDLT